MIEKVVETKDSKTIIKSVPRSFVKFYKEWIRDMLGLVDELGKGIMDVAVDIALVGFVFSPFIVAYHVDKYVNNWLVWFAAVLTVFFGTLPCALYHLEKELEKEREGHDKG